MSSSLSDVQFDQICMRLAVMEARHSVDEDDQPHPRVGVVIAINQDILATSYRGATGAGHHAEFGALELKLPHERLAGATVYTTLEPCTTRNHPKIPCAKRLLERRVGRVVVGMVDPDSRISGKGLRLLQDAGVAVDMFSQPLVEELLELNRVFIRTRTQIPARIEHSAGVPEDRESKIHFVGTWTGTWRDPDGRTGEEIIYILTSNGGEIRGTFFDKEFPEAPVVFEGIFRHPYLRVQFHSPYAVSAGKGAMEDGTCFLQLQSDGTFTGFYASFNNHGRYELRRKAS